MSIDLMSNLFSPKASILLPSLLSSLDMPVLRYLLHGYKYHYLFSLISDNTFYSSAVAILKTIIPNTKNREIAPTPIFTFPVNCAMRLITVVPRKEAPFPHMSISPKYSPDFSAGMILVK